jgi:hypothetical protein
VLAGNVWAEAIASKRAAFSAHVLFEGELVDASGNTPAAIGLISVAVTAANSATIQLSVAELGGNPGDTQTVSIADSRTNTNWLQFSTTVLADGTVYQQLPLGTTGLDALLEHAVEVSVATSGTGGATLKGLIRLVPRQFVGLLAPDADSAYPENGGIAAIAVATIRSASVAVSVWASGLAEEALDNSAVTLGSSKDERFKFNSHVKVERQSIETTSWYDSRGALPNRLDVVGEQLANGLGFVENENGGGWVATVRTASGAVCTGTLRMVDLAHEYSTTTLEEDEKAGIFNVLFSDRYGPDTVSSGATSVGWMSARFDAKRARLDFILKVVPRTDNHIAFIAFREGSPEGTILHTMPSATAHGFEVTGTWLFSDDQAASVLKLFARGDVYACVVYESTFVTTSAAQLNGEPLFVAAPSEVFISETATPGTLMFSNAPARRYVYFQEPLVYVTLADDHFAMRGRTSSVEVRDSGYGFDYNRQQEFAVKVQTTDPGSGRVDVISVKVSLADVNNLSPRFPQRIYRAEVGADAPPGTIVAELMADDGDVSFPELTYSLLQGSNSDVADMFEVKTLEEEDVDGNYQYRAQLVTRAAIQPLVAAAVTLSIQVDDGANEVDVASVIVTVSATNDATPQFATNASASCADNACILQEGGSIPEDIPLGTEVFWFSATDADLGPNGAITFSTAAKHLDSNLEACGRGTGMFSAVTTVTGNGANRLFRGALVVVRALDFESTPDYIICVAAVDGGTPAMKTTIQIHLTVTDVSFKILLADSNLLVSSTDAPLYLPPSESDVKVVFGVNGEGLQLEAGANLLYRIRVDREGPVDCLLSDWTPETVCTADTGQPMRMVSETPCRQSAAEQLGQMKMSRVIEQVRDPNGLGQDCPRETDFKAAKFLADHDFGDVLLVQWVDCGNVLCSNVVPGTGGSDGNGVGADSTNSTPGISIEAATALMNAKTARNGFHRNHPKYDGWGIDGVWLPQEAWTSLVVQTISWSASNYSAAHGVLGVYEKCDDGGLIDAGTLSLPVCRKSIERLTGGPHVIDVEVLQDVVGQPPQFQANFSVPFVIDRDVRCAFTGRNLHSRMPLVPTPARFKRAGV